MPNDLRRIALVGGLLLPLAAGGCVRRVVEITSEPSGAVVWMNDREVGTTPCEVEILHYGTYDVRVAKDGWEPISEGRDATPPAWDLPGPDLVAELLPFELESRTAWHVELKPEDLDPDAVMARAEATRDRLIALDSREPKPGDEGTIEGLEAEVREADGGPVDPEAIGRPVEGPIEPLPPEAGDPEAE